MMPGAAWARGHNLGVPQPAHRARGRPAATKTADTRKRIIGAAREVFSERGYDAATFQEISTRVDLTRPAINHYFHNKRVLYREVLDQTNEAAVAASIRRAQLETTLMERLSAFIRATIQADSENPSAAACLVSAVLESQRHPGLSRVEHDSLRRRSGQFRTERTKLRQPDHPAHQMRSLGKGLPQRVDNPLAILRCKPFPEFVLRIVAGEQAHDTIRDDFVDICGYPSISLGIEAPAFSVHRRIDPQRSRRAFASHAVTLSSPTDTDRAHRVPDSRARRIWRDLVRARRRDGLCAR